MDLILSEVNAAIFVNVKQTLKTQLDYGIMFTASFKEARDDQRKLAFRV